MNSTLTAHLIQQRKQVQQCKFILISVVGSIFVLILANYHFKNCRSDSQNQLPNTKLTEAQAMETAAASEVCVVPSEGLSKDCATEDPEEAAGNKHISFKLVYNVSLKHFFPHTLAILIP